MKERLIQFLEYLNIGQAAFEKNVGLSNGFVNNVGDSIRRKSIDKISIRYPELNIAWLQTGVGDMFNTLSRKVPAQAPANTSQGDITMPREVFDQIQGLIGAVTSQQQTISSQQQMMADMVKNIDQAAVLKAISALDDKVDKKGACAGNAGAVAG